MTLRSARRPALAASGAECVVAAECTEQPFEQRGIGFRDGPRECFAGGKIASGSMLVPSSRAMSASPGNASAKRPEGRSSVSLLAIAPAKSVSSSDSGALPRGTGATPPSARR